MKTSFLSGGRAAFIGAAIGAVFGVIEYWKEWQLGPSMAAAALETVVIMAACAIVAVILARLLRYSA
jgi:hypothetical protein